jgi:hypothetical protein
MQFKTLSLGLAVAIASSVTLAAPVDYKIDPTHTATVFSWNHFGFQLRVRISLIFKVQLKLIMQNLKFICRCDDSNQQCKYQCCCFG